MFHLHHKVIQLRFLLFVFVGLFIEGHYATAQETNTRQYPSRTEIIYPLHKNTLNNNGECKEWKQGGNPRKINGYDVFDGAMDGYRQVDPQIAVGKNYILHGTNNGLLVYDKKGNYKMGVPQSCFNNGIDPKIFYDIHNRIFIFDLWWYYDHDKKKPVNLSVSETDNPMGAWNTYPISLPDGVDGGGIGYSRQWIGYTFPGGTENTIVIKTAAAKAGEPLTAYHFKGNFGQPVFVQDDIDALYFFKIEGDRFVVRYVRADDAGNPYASIVLDIPHHLQYINFPLPSAQKGTTQKVASGDRNPKSVVLQNGSLWFSQTVNCEGHAAVQWIQLNLQNGKIEQQGLLRNKNSNYIQTTLAVNQKEDVVIGFQEVNENMFISPRFVIHNWSDPKGGVGKMIHIGEGKAATDGLSWGDYSGTIIDGDNLSDLWTVQSITNEQGKGSTVIAKIPFRQKRSFWWWLFHW